MAPTENTSPAPEAAISPLAEALTQIPIEAVDEKFLSPRSNAELEEFLTYIHVMLIALKGKAELAAKILDFRHECLAMARKYRTLAPDDLKAILATKPAETAAEIVRAMDVLAKGPEAGDKPPTQNLAGSVITSESKVNPGQ